MLTRPLHLALTCIALLTVIGIGVGQAGAAIPWNDPGGGQYRDPDNWDGGGGIPGTGNDIYFGLNSTYTVTFTQNEMNNRAIVRTGEVTFDLSSYQHDLVYAHSAPPSLLMGDAADTDSKLTVLGGRLNIGHAHLATGASSGATLEIGAGGSVGNSRTIEVGKTGDAELRIIDGGKLLKRDNMFANATIGMNDGSLGIVTVQGVGSEWQPSGFVAIGGFGTGIVNLSGGASTTAYGGNVAVGAWEDGNGTLTVTGSGTSFALAARPGASYFTPGDLMVGNSGIGTLTVSGGASVSGATNLEAGQAAGSIPAGETEYVGRGDGTITVTGNGTTLTTVRGMKIGDSGDGELDILGGADVTVGGKYATDSSRLAVLPGSTGEVLVSGAGSTLTVNSYLYMGLDTNGDPGGQASLTVTNGGRVDVANLILGPSTTITTDALVIGPPQVALKALGTVPGLYANTMVVADGADVTAGSLTLNPGGSIGGDGGVSADLFNDGTVGPGDSVTYSGPVAGVGTLNVSGNYTQTAGATLLIDLADGEFDLLAATGAADLDGLLEIRLMDGFAPQQGDTFSFLTAAGGRSGKFADMTFAGLDESLTAKIVYGANSATLRIVPEPSSATAVLLAGLGFALRRRRVR